MGASQSQPTVLPTSYPLQTKPVKPTLEGIPRTYVGTKPNISLPVYDTGLDDIKVDGQPLKISQNPIARINEATETEVINGIRLLTLKEPGIFTEMANTGYMDESLRRTMGKYYKELLLTFLKFMKKDQINIEMCGEELNFYAILSLIGRKSTRKILGFSKDYPNYSSDPDLELLHTTGFPLYEESDFDKFKKRFTKTDDEVLNNMEKYVQSKFRFTTINGKSPSSNSIVEKIKKELISCRNRYYIIPIGYFTLGETDTSGHQNLLILDRFNEQAIVIEPQFYGTKYEESTDGNPKNKYLKPIYTNILQKLNLNYEIVIPVTIYPQAIAEDTNCLFWTFLITVTYFLNSGEVSPDTIASTIIRKYPSKDALIDYIKGFKAKIFFYLNAYESFKTSAGKRRRKMTHCRKTKRNAQKRIVHANRK